MFSGWKMIKLFCWITRRPGKTGAGTFDALSDTAQLYADALSRVFSTDTKKMVAEEKLIYSFHLKEVVAL